MDKFLYQLKRIQFFPFFLLLLAGWLFPASLTAQVRFRAQVSKPSVSINEPFEVIYIAAYEEGNVHIQAPPSFPGFRIVGGPMEQSSSSINVSGTSVQKEVVKAVAYALVAERPGTYSLPPARLSRNGRWYTSNAASVVVTHSIYHPQQTPNGGNWGPGPMGGPSPSAEPARAVLLKAFTNKRKVYVGEAINVTYKLMTRVPMQAQPEAMPSLSGFWVDEITQPQPIQPHDEVYEGAHYNVFTLKKAVAFPQKAGTLVLDPMKLNVQIMGGFADPDEDKTFISTPENIEVMPLPSNAPASFTNAVGHFKPTAVLQNARVTTDDMGILTLSITGAGNLKLISAPALALPSGLSALPAQGKVTISAMEPTETGTHTFTYQISAAQPGTYTIPPVTFTYFDPTSGKYVTMQTNSFTLTVTQGVKSKGLFTNGRNDIHDIITKGNFVQSGEPWIYSPLYWSLAALPVIALIIGLARKKRQDYNTSHAVSFKARVADTEARRRLKNARNLLNNPDHTAFYEEISKAIWLYMSDKLGIPLSALNMDNVVEQLRIRNVESPVISQTTSLLEEVQMALYSPAGGLQQRNETLEQAVKVLTALSRYIGKK